MDSDKFKRLHTECKTVGHKYMPFADKLEKCDHCSCIRYRVNHMTYMDSFYCSSKRTLDSIRENPLLKKLLNYIRNDLAGILNSFKDKYVTFEFNSFLETITFFEDFRDIMKRNMFHEQQFNKKQFKQELSDYLQSKYENGEFQVGEKQEIFFDVFPLNDREFRLLTFIEHNYD